MAKQKTALTSLEANKKQIIAEHRAGLLSAQQAIVHAINAGELLELQKAALPHGEFVSYVQKELPFTVRTAQNYMRAFKEQTKIKDSNVEKLTDVYALLTEPKAPAKPIDVSPRDDAHEEDDEPIVMNQEKAEEAYDSTMYWYLTDLRICLAAMGKAHRTLARKRTNGTPTALGHMIGNIEAMRQRLKTWEPEQMEDCDICEGTGKVEANGKAVQCKNCIDGKVGTSVETSL